MFQFLLNFNHHPIPDLPYKLPFDGKDRIFSNFTEVVTDWDLIVYD